MLSITWNGMMPDSSLIVSGTCRDTMAQGNYKASALPVWHFDVAGKAVFLDGTRYVVGDRVMVLVLDLLAQADQDRPVSFKRLKTVIPNLAEHEKTFRRQLARLPPPVRACLRSKRGGGRWLEVRRPP